MIDLSYAHALPVMPYQAQRIHLVVVGLGGNGSFFARHSACLAYVLRAQGRQVEVTFIDPDTVEAVNIPRQNFCQAEIGHVKAATLAARYSDVFSLEIGVIAEPFAPDMVTISRETLTILVGCVDRASGRVALGDVLTGNREYVTRGQLPRIWYLDLGNGLDLGQITFGSTDRPEDLAAAFSLSPLGVSLLPSPLVQFPGLRIPQAEEVADHPLSCAQLLAANAQSLMINPVMADIGSGYLYEFLVLGTLKRFCTFIDLPTGTMRSRYTTPAHLATSVNADPTLFHPAKRVAHSSNRRA